MDFSFLADINISHLLRPQFNAVTFSLFGMAMVFIGLLIISLYVLALPNLLRWFNDLRNHGKAVLSSPSDDDSAEDQAQEEALVAIATALFLHQDFPEEQERITFKSHGDLDSPWKISGRVRSLSMRSPARNSKDFRRM